ncbi:MAG: hypothetical protein JSV51_08735 [Candidatus Bathyarchaeota archaeon]|nr:MAG: hypothetical protein JSV51_08735 [Candidatus Bathyarchaeota archaeon]
MSKVKTILRQEKIRLVILRVFTLLILLGYSLQSVSGSVQNSMVMRITWTVNSPPVILEEGNITSASTIYTNNTSAKVIVTSSPTNTTHNYDYILRVNNTITDPWEIRLQQYSDLNINRLTNCTIYFYNFTDGPLDQIYLENGAYIQSTGSWYDIESSQTIYIAVKVEANSTGTSRIFTYLEILVPNTTIYTQYTILFEIT